ncbi:acyl-CoA N-acyltransferase [Lipomyces arxii]|uniref:acyl-CoA N-acyltransferase n=1 Tax=Lipomyces arxii TaxID=56418 RepID=UPI0034CFDD5F
MTIIYRKYEPPISSLTEAFVDPRQIDNKPLERPRETVERDLTAIRKLISLDLSEPYGIYVYRYFIYQWPHLCFIAIDNEPSEQVESKPTEKSDEENLVGVVVCKLAPHRTVKMRGYIAMLAVAKTHRGRGIASQLVRMAIDCMIDDGAHEIVLEAEVENESALQLYENMGFMRSKRMYRYYMNGSDAFRLVLPVKEESTLRYCVLSNELDIGQLHNGNDMYI